jgi:cell fate regulator YaaT (PSP1 superfamily)
VKVESDRGGYEVGVVCQRTLQFCSASSSRHLTRTQPQPASCRKKIVERATENEKKHLLMKLRDETRALQICNELAARRKLPILMLDAEFQNDRNKLTFLYVSDV